MMTGRANRSARIPLFRILTLSVFAVASGTEATSQEARITLNVRQITFGPRNHFFGYIGHVKNIPWNGNGRYILALRTTFQDRLPEGDDPADVVLIDTENDFTAKVVDQSRAWNPQQGTMFYWNPVAPDTQFFFNDRDPATGKVFCVLFDITKGTVGGRVQEYRFSDTPIGNSGVAQRGSRFLAINYGRMARLRPVTGYRGAFDWTTGTAYPQDDGIFVVDVTSGKKSLLVSFYQLAQALRQGETGAEIPPLFINHTLWNREDDRIFFFVRGGWNGRGQRINQPFTVWPDGTHLTLVKQHIGGHPEWESGHRMIGSIDERQIIYDTERQRVVGQLGSPQVFPKPEGDVALSPDGEWFVNGFKDGHPRRNYYIIYRRKDGASVRSPGFDIGEWTSGDLRLDPAPCWNRDSSMLLVPGLSLDGSRQLFVIEIHST